MNGDVVVNLAIGNTALLSRVRGREVDIEPGVDNLEAVLSDLFEESILGLDIVD